MVLCLANTSIHRTFRERCHRVLLLTTEMHLYVTNIYHYFTFAVTITMYGFWVILITRLEVEVQGHHH